MKKLYYVTRGFLVLKTTQVWGETKEDAIRSSLEEDSYKYRNLKEMKETCENLGEDDINIAEAETTAINKQ